MTNLQHSKERKTTTELSEQNMTTQNSYLLLLLLVVVVVLLLLFILLLLLLVLLVNYGFADFSGYSTTVSRSFIPEVTKTLTRSQIDTKEN